jgi:hypothetical protein
MYTVIIFRVLFRDLIQLEVRFLDESAHIQ